MQTRYQTAIEVITNTTIGLAGSWLITYGTLLSFKDPITVAWVSVSGCTVWSIARGYWVRRFFASIHR